MSVVFSRYSGFHHDIAEILLKVTLNTITLTTLRYVPCTAKLIIL